MKPSSGERLREDAIPVNNSRRHLSLAQQREALPIYKHKNSILYAIETYSVVVVVGETGSGKSTQIPVYLHEAGWLSPEKGVIICEPRKMAAITLASRVADELGVQIGDEVGYAVRFDSKISSKTCIRYVTDGLLLRYLLSDPLLFAYNVIIVDEAHERSLHSDVLLGLLKKIRRKRPEIKIVITSATINALAMKEFFEGINPNTPEACIVVVEGKTYPVDILYLSTPTSSYVKETVSTILKIHRNEGKGDILSFLPGAEEVDTALEMLRDQYAGADLSCLPLYSALPSSSQMLIFQPAAHKIRKCILATNIAETSLTIDGIRFVIDCGFAKLPFFDVKSGVESLITCPISQASAKQRCGRAARTQPGKCFRLYTELDYSKLAPFTVPEIQRADLSWVVLELKALAVQDILYFDFMSSPSADAMIHALELLHSLGAIDSDCNLTRIGSTMADMPIEPRLARSLLKSFELGCGEEMLSVAAMCDVEFPFLTVRNRASEESKQRLLDCMALFVSIDGDPITLMNVYNGFVSSGYSSSWCDQMMINYRMMSRARELRQHLASMLKRLSRDEEYAVISSCGDDMISLRKCLIAGYFDHAAQLGSDGKYHTVRGKVVVGVHHTSVLARFGAPPEWVIFNDIVHTKEALMRDVSKIEPKWLLELAPHYYKLVR